MVARHVDGLDGGDVLDVGDVGRTHHAEDLVQARVHPGAVERRATLLARLGQQLRDGLARRVRVVGVAVPAGDPVRRGDDVDARLEDLDVQVLVGEHAVKGQHIGLGRDDLLDRAGGRHTVRRQAGQLARVLADLLRRIAVHADQFQIGLRWRCA